MRKNRTQGTWLTLLLLLLVLLIWHFARPILLPEGPSGAKGHYLLLIAQEAILFGVPALFLRPWRSRGVRRSPRWRQGCLLALPMGILLALLLGPVSAGWSSLMRVAPQETPLPGTPLEWALMVMAMVVAPALAEEAFFRGGVFCGLAWGMGGKAAFAMTVAIFTLMHGRVAALPAHLACGALFTLGMLRYDRLWPSIMMHASYNAATLTLAWLGVTLPWFSLAATVPVMAVVVTAMLRRTAWCERKPLDGISAALGIVTLAVLVFYFLVQL